MRVGEKRLLNNRTPRPVELTLLGMGGAPLGNLYQSMSDDAAADAVKAALESGVGYFDTAPFYGLGLSETRMGAALAGVEATLSTKIGRLLFDCAPDEATPDMYVDTPARRIVFDYSYDAVMRSFESSVARLGRRPDILLIHDIDPGTHGQDKSDAHMRELFDGGGYRALSELRANGEIAAIGAGVNAWQICEQLLGEAEFDCFLLAGRYTLLEQEALDSFLPLCVARDVGILLGGPYNSGILATGPIAGARYNYEPAPQEILDRAAALQRVCQAHDTPLIAAALQFVLGHPAVRSVLPGAKSRSEVAANAAVLETPVPTQLWSDLRSEGLIRKDAPLPGEHDVA